MRDLKRKIKSKRFVCKFNVWWCNSNRIDRKFFLLFNCTRCYAVDEATRYGAHILEDKFAHTNYQYYYYNWYYSKIEEIRRIRLLFARSFDDCLFKISDVHSKCICLALSIFQNQKLLLNIYAKHLFILSWGWHTLQKNK